MKTYIIFFGLFLISICNAQLPHTFTQNAHIDDGGRANDIAVSPNGTIFLANDLDGLRAYEYDGSNFINTAHIYDGGWAVDVTFHYSSTVFLANGYDGLRAYIYNGSSFFNTAHYSMGVLFHEVAVYKNGVVFAASSQWNYSDTRAFEYDGITFYLIASLPDGGQVAIDNDGTIFVCNRQDLNSYTFHNYNFTFVASFPMSGVGATITIGRDNTIFLANYNRGLRALEYNGNSFSEIAHVNDGGRAYEVAIDSDGTVFLANYDDGLRAYNYDGSSFTNTAHIDNGDTATCVAVGIDGTVFTGNYRAGLKAYTYSGTTGLKDELTKIPLQFTLSQNYPNPFNPSTKIKYTLLKTGNVKIEILNLLGQKIETLLNRRMTAGSHEIEFTAMDLPGGVYLYRIQAGGYQEVRKMILMK